MNRQKRRFLSAMLAIAVPVTLQNLLFSSFTLIDTLMIGTLGDTPLAAVGMAGKWTWFLTIVLFGFSSGASVFFAQYFGAGSTRQIHRTYGLLSMGSLLAAAAFMLPALLAPESIVGLFTGDAQVISTGADYLRIIALSYPFQALARSAGTLLQSTRRVSIPFIGAAASVAVNILFNALLIFGLCGFPAMGVRGAAIASLLAAVVNAAVVFFLGLRAHTMMRAPLSAMLAWDGQLIRSYLVISMPAMLNETLWALGNLLYSSVFGHMGTQAYAAITVVRSIEELTSVAFMGLCSSCAVMIGSAVGQNDRAEAVSCARRHIGIAVILSLLIGGMLLLVRTPLLSLFGISPSVRIDALFTLVIYALELPLRTLPLILVVGIFRAGGDTRFGLMIDALSMYLIGLPITAAAGLVFHLSVPITYLIMYLSEDVFKCIAYLLHMHSGKWIRPVTQQNKPC